MSLNYITISLIACGGGVVGYAFFLLVYKMLPRRLRADHGRQKEDILSYARQQAQTRRTSEAERLDEEYQLIAEQEAADDNERREDLKIQEADLASQEQSLVAQEGRIQKFSKELELHTQKTSSLQISWQAKEAEIESIKKQLKSSLEAAAQVDANGLQRTIFTNMIETRQIDCQRSLKFFEDELTTTAKKRAERLMARVMARYAPEFCWPKSINFVELGDAKTAEKVVAEGAKLISDMTEKAGIELEVLQGPDVPAPIIKLSGGAGINREAVRLALSDLIPKDAASWAKAASIYDRYREQLEQQAIKLGRQALREVKLSGIHPEIQKLVGYLNWRTSYRQNQWYHTVEVAKLAGIIAQECGIDVDAAKRVGLLHDIGKAIDYRIEGSHAVISGDYADRFGEKRLICDTVMSHHNDLVIETPLAYVLKAADTLSGARPGARVNLEEGYQMRLSGIESSVRSFPGIVSLAIMNGAREVHVEVNHKRVQESDLERLSQSIAKKIQEEVAFPGEIKILVSRRFEATAVA